VRGRDTVIRSPETEDTGELKLMAPRGGGGSVVAPRVVRFRDVI
jgi:hypothetical protein